MPKSGGSQERMRRWISERESTRAVAAHRQLESADERQAPTWCRPLPLVPLAVALAGAAGMALALAAGLDGRIAWASAAVAGRSVATS